MSDYDENDLEDMVQCSDCGGNGGEVREVFGRLAFITCIHCAGYGYNLPEPYEDE